MGFEIKIGNPMKILSYCDRVLAENYELARDFDRRPAYVVKKILEFSFGSFGEVCGHSPLVFSRRLVLASLIAGVIAEASLGRYKHLTIAIVGTPGSGKTTYSVYSSIGALLLSGVSYDDALKIVSERIFFEPESLLAFLNKIKDEYGKKWYPVVIIDDIGVQISKYWLHLGERHWINFFKMLEQLKESIGVLIVTARSFEGIASKIREIVDIIVQSNYIIFSEGFRVGLFEFFSPEVWRRRKKYARKYVDVILPCVRLPEDLWSRMISSRSRMIEESVRKLNEKMRDEESEEGSEDVE